MTSTAPAAPRSRRVFYGWWIVLASAVQLMTSSGLGFYGLAVYLNAIHEQRGISVGAVSGAIAVFFVVSGVVGIPVAKILRTRDPRAILPPGAVVAALGLVAIGRSTQTWQVYCSFALFGAGFAATSIAITNTVVTRWFQRRRSFALSVATSGLSVGGVVCAPLLKTFLNRADGLDRYMVWVAVAYVLGVLVVPMILLRPDPAALGMFPDGASEPPIGAAGQRFGASGIALADALRTPMFVLLTVVFLASLGAQVGGLQHVVQLGKERDGARTAATMVSVLAACSFVGRLIAGGLVGRIPIRRYSFYVLCLQALGLVLMGQAHSAFALVASVVIFGSSVGNVLLLHPLLIAEEFGVKDYPGIYARSQLWVNLGIAGGPFLVGLMHDSVGGYAGAYTGAAVLSLGAATLYYARVRSAPVLVGDFG